MGRATLASLEHADPGRAQRCSLGQGLAGEAGGEAETLE
jgi:hypothetical protein